MSASAEAQPKDADRILATFKDDPELRFKIDDGRDEKRKKGGASKADKPQRNKPSRRERREMEKAEKAGNPLPKEKPAKKGRKPLREDFWNWLEEGEENL